MFRKSLFAIMAYLLYSKIHRVHDYRNGCITYWCVHEEIQVKLDQDCINNSTEFPRSEVWDDGIS